MPVYLETGEILAACEDITERKRAEKKLREYRDHLEDMVRERTERIQELESQRTEIEKLASAGLLAARIAHEINNPLAGIKNSFLLVKDGIPKDHPYHEYVGRIEKEVDRITRIVRQMFDLYRPEQEIKNRFLIDKTIYDVVALLEAACQENSLAIKVDTKSIMVEMHEGSLRQILYNILINAIEASPKGGIIRIMTEVNDNNLVFSISDQGAGIPFKVRSHIFEPFFTTKHGSKRGLGLGLSISKEIVEKLGGHISFESETGKETVFKIILPIRSGRKGVSHG
jgi:signal transduction histidine kinase